MKKGKKLRIAIRSAIHSLLHMRFGTWMVILLLTCISAVFVLPIIYIVCNAFKPLNELFLYPPRFFVKNPTLQNFYEFIYATDTSIVPFSRYLFNSLFVTVITVALTIVFSLACAFAFSKMKFPGKGWLFKVIIVALMFSPEAVVITRYLIVSGMGLLDTFWAHILPQLALPMGVFMIKQFMDQIPDSLCEAAHIDGANDFQVLFRIIAPSVAPAIGTVLIVSFQAVWGDTTTSTLYTFTESRKTMPYFISTLTSGITGSSVARVGAAAAAGLILFLPNFIIFFVLQKSMIATMVTSGIK